MKYIVREIEEKDNKEVENVIRTCLIEFGANHKGTAWSDPNLGRFSKIYNTPGNKYWIVENEEEKIVGGVGIGRLEGIDDVCELQKMYCLPEARGTGISHKLMDTALEYARQYYSRCYLETLENMVAAHKFYEKYGFERIYKPIIQTEHFACDVRYIKDLKETTIYLIRHAETVDENGIRNTSENSQLINEKEILSVKGEEQAKKLSENEELKNLDSIWSSSYTRAKATAKYISNANNLPFNIDNDLGERKLGNLKELGEFMKDKATRDPSQEQLLDRTFRTSDGESAEQTRERMNRFFNKILEEYKGKRIAVISHGGSIKFFLLNWCEVNEEVKLIYNKNLILNIKSPCLLKLTFSNNELVNIEQID